MDEKCTKTSLVPASGTMNPNDHFKPPMQDAFRSLVLDGMAARWGPADDSLMPDLNDIDARYGEDIVLVALDGKRVVGTAILVLRHFRSSLTW
jgi:hypothetical protein